VADHVYFEDFDVDLDTGEIRRQGVRVRLRGKPCRILVTLLRQPGEIVLRQQLIDSLWSSNTFVDFDSNLKTALSNLRRVLGDSADYPRFIETVQGVGYRFLQPISKVQPVSPVIAEVPVSDDASSPFPISDGTDHVDPKFLRVPGGSLEESDWRHIIAAAVVLMISAISVFLAFHNKTSASSHDKTSRVMLILPFENLTGDASTESLSDGITNQMTDALQKKLNGKVAVLAGDSARTYKHTHKTLDSISKELGGVDYVLEGTVRRSRDTVDIDAELFRVSDHKSIWTGTFEHKLADIQSFQQDIAAHILESISVEIIQAEWPDLRSGPVLDQQPFYPTHGL
jgi:TolB-like protein/DNA-binding winged helix-turn-helix (wHTH) protein